MSKNKYYYDYTRNMSDEQAEKADKCCGKPSCLKNNCSKKKIKKNEKVRNFHI